MPEPEPVTIAMHDSREETITHVLVEHVTHEWDGSPCVLPFWSVRAVRRTEVPDRSGPSGSKRTEWALVAGMFGTFEGPGMKRAALRAARDYAKRQSKPGRAPVKVYVSEEV